MKKASVRVTVDIPAPMYRKLQEQAADSLRFVKELVLAGVKKMLLPSRRLSSTSRRVKFPLIVSEGPKVDLTNEQIYGLMAPDGRLRSGKTTNKSSKRPKRTHHD